ncbi:MAG: hypothetical protein H6R18_1423 [Proteobacteria bacterium]|nr:hypothetical protein [Pseudomonadota bacterium]
MRKVRCPQCGGDAVFSPGNPFRPFCCERCRMIDMGAWASESYRIQAEPESPEEHQALLGDPETLQ